jgi:dTDP-glucose pyrophosphorylase
MAHPIDPKKLFISLTTRMSEAIGVIDRGVAQIALVVDDDHRLLGTVTDGDIRRGLLKSMTLDAPVEHVMQRKFRSLRGSDSESDALKLMRLHGLHQIPVLDDHGRVLRIHLLEKLLHLPGRPNAVVLMAGGRGERLRPLTSDCPKPMLPVGGRPILEIILRQCVEAGFGHFYLSVNYLKQQIIDHFGNGSRWGVRIEYLEEEMPLGTGGALSLLPPNLLDPVLVMNGDLLTRVDFNHLMQFHHEYAAEVTMCVREHVTQIPYGVVQLDGTTVRGFQEKPALSHFVNAGIYVVSPNALTLLQPNTHCDMPLLLERVNHQPGRIRAFPIHEYWLDVGQHDMLLRAHGEWT